MDLVVWKYRFGKERYIKQINDIREWQKIMAEFGGKMSYLKRIRGYDTGEERGGSRHSFVGNDKNNVIVNSLLSYFLCLSFRDYMAI